MLRCFRKLAACVPQRWVNLTLDHSLALLIAAVLLTAGVVAYTVSNFTVNTNLTEMVSDELPFRKDIKEYRRLFPQLTDTIVVVVEADTPELALESRKKLAAKLVAEKDKLQSVFAPGGGDFFEKNGLLYLSITELESLTDNLAAVQPFLALLSQDLSLGNFFSILEEYVDASAESIPENERILLLFDRLSDAIEHSVEGRPYHLSWQEVMLGKAVKQSQLRQFIIVEPVLDYSSFAPGKKAIQSIRNIAHELGLNGKNGVRIKITGSVALKNADLASVSSGIGIAATVSVILVAVVLYIGLRSARLVVASLITLIMGISWTMGFAIAAIGSLNMISIAFVVLFIGLGVDYSIQFSLRYTELLDAGFEYRSALYEAATEVGSALLLCTITTAIGFYAFVPTAYVGASELGIISGTGMFFIFIANLTVLPALLNLFRARGRTIHITRVGAAASSFINKHPDPIIIGTVIFGIGAALLLPKVTFDFNPLNLSDQAAEPVATAKELFTDGKTSPWSIAIVTDNLEQATDHAARLKQLPEIETALTVADFVPDNQPEKLALIDDIALFMPALPENTYTSNLDAPETLKALKSFAGALKNSLLSGSGRNDSPNAVIARLHENIERLMQHGSAPHNVLPSLNLLEGAITGPLTITLQNLDTLIHQPSEFDLPDLPKELRDRYISENGRHLVQVFPRENISDLTALKRFVMAVRTVAPNATSKSVTIYESGKAIVSAFRNALVYALTMIVILLLLILRSWRMTLLILAPLILAMLFSAVATVLFSIPFNYANIIVLPLILGIGIDYGIHLVHRWRSNSMPGNELLQTSTARAVVFSALTTVISFSSLIFSSHRGTAGMGLLLSICTGLMLFCTLIILPAVLKRLESFR